MAQPPYIVTKFVKEELSKILSDYLTNPELGDKRIALKDRLAIKLMLTLNKKFYRDRLLFRDFSQKPSDLLESYVLPDGSQKNLHTECIYYTQDVLAKRLTIVSKHKSSPNNLHLLLLMFFHNSKDDRWLRACIERKKNATCINDLYFKKTANILKRQCNRLKDVKPLSITYREKYGIFHFICGNNSTELVEEISLFDAVEAAPTPLKILTISLPYISLLERVLLSLNEEYALLRSCGLPPQQWHGHDDLSVSKLRALKQLKKLANSYQEIDNYSAYQQAFSTILNEKTKIAGFEDFTKFSHSAVGRILLKMETVSFDAENEDSYSLAETYSENDLDIDPIEAAEGLEKILVDHADSFTVVTAYFFKQAIVLQRPLHSENGVLNDTEFCNSLKNDDTYFNLEGEKLADKLIRTTGRIIKKHMNIEGSKNG